MGPTIIVASIIGLVFVAIIVNEIRKKIQGKSSCSCGGNCGACGLCPSKKED
ncbi:MAG: FeoB-associated Cys-rich membrane protein [Clostridia bacterium]|nr:FeoB-associated Cys-rich membrane protein [Clostridia bacterium]